MASSLPDAFAMTAPYDHAIYLPAVQPSYAAVRDLNLDRSRPLPAGFAIEDLEFWSGTSKLWNHKFLLHSIGTYKVGADPRGQLFSRGTGTFTVVGDSGGYQIGMGTFAGFNGLRSGMNGDHAVAAWKENYDGKRWLIRLLDHYCDYAMTIDMPLWAATSLGTNSPFHGCSEAQLLAMTNDNLRLIEEEMDGRAKWLNVITGTNPEDIVRWWDSVKWFRHGGWALAGTAGWRGGLASILSTVLMMRDETAFEPGQDWMHVLGVSRPVWDVLLTTIQREIRKLNPAFQISFDSASAFRQGGMNDEYALPPKLGADLKDWSIRYDKLLGLQKYADPAGNLPFPVSSPLGDQLMLHHLVVDGSELSGRRIDTLTNMMLINHSLWVYLDAGRRANVAAFGSNARDLPQKLAAAVDVIEAAFAAENWTEIIESERAVLDAIAKG